MEQEKEKNEETFVKKVVQTALEAERQIRRQQVLHNTRMLMEEYIEMKRHIESAVSEEEELKEEQYDVFRGEGAHLGSVRRSKMKTAMMIANIDRAMEELRAEYETKEMVYKYDAFKMHYIDGVSYEEIADIQNCGKNTPSRWSKELIRKMSVKLFGMKRISITRMMEWRSEKSKMAGYCRFQHCYQTKDWNSDRKAFRWHMCSTISCTLKTSKRCEDGQLEQQTTADTLISYLHSTEWV